MNLLSSWRGGLSHMLVCLRELQVISRNFVPHRGYPVAHVGHIDRLPHLQFTVGFSGAAMKLRLFLRIRRLLFVEGSDRLMIRRRLRASDHLIQVVVRDDGLLGAGHYSG